MKKKEFMNNNGRGEEKIIITNIHIFAAVAYAKQQCFYSQQKTKKNIEAYKHEMRGEEEMHNMKLNCANRKRSSDEENIRTN